MIRRVFILLAIGATFAEASPINDLASPNQAIRDRAAEILRATYQPNPQAKWGPLLVALKSNMMRSQFEYVLSYYHLGKFSVDSRELTSREKCRLDDDWVLHVDFGMGSGKDPSKPLTIGPENLVIDWDVSKEVRFVRVEPPPNFTGTWTTYYVNGHKAEEIDYRKGTRLGFYMRYYEDGTQQTVALFTAVGIIDMTTYYPSGKLESRAFLADLAYTTNYSEDGVVSSTNASPIKPLAK